MAMSVSSSAIRDAIRANILTAWTALQVYYHAPLTPTETGDLPRAFVMIPEVEPARERGQAGFGQAELAFLCVITGQFAFPGSGNLQDAKESKADALIALLTASETYVSSLRDVRAVRYDDLTLETNETVYQVTIEFEVRTTTDA